MEVKDPNQSDQDPKGAQARSAGTPARRREDHVDYQRSLNWSTRDSDISLKPHSPLALADVLAAQNGTFVLVSTDQNDNNEDIAETDSVVSMQKRRKLKNPRSRANLLTNHSTPELLEQCRQMLVNNALVKQPGLQKLYMVTGFIKVQLDAEATPLRAPLLFYPAILVRSTKRDAQEHPDSKDYFVKVENNVPETNPSLHTLCATKLDVELPEYDGVMPLQDYFAQIAAITSQHDSLELEFSIGMGTAVPPHGAANLGTALPELPPQFDNTIAKTITENKTLKELETVLNLLRDYSLPRPKATPGVTELHGSTEIAKLREYSRKLAAAQLEHVEFEDLPLLPEQIREWVKSAEPALRSNTLNLVGNSRSISVRHLIKLSSVIELIDKAPNNLEQFRHPDLCYAVAGNLFQRAKHQAKLIEDELADMKSYFLLDKIPAKAELLTLIEELSGSLERGPDLVDADYFNARRSFMEFSIEKPTNLTPEHRNKLNKLAKILRFRELFVNNTEYRLALGNGYRGLRTEWDQLEDVLVYSQEFADVVESESISAKALGDWLNFRQSFIEELHLLQASAESLYQLIRTMGASWQHKYVDQLLAKALKTADQLEQWHEQYGAIKQYQGRTPASVLSQFTGTSKEDLITEIHVGETQAQIDKHLSSEQTTAQSIVDTIAWLREASHIAIDNALDIDTIVEHASSSTK